MKKYAYLPLVLLYLTHIGCRTCTGCNDPIPPNPGALFLSIKHNGNTYPDSLMGGVQLYYYYNGKKIINPNDAPSRPSNIMYDDTVFLQRVYTHDSIKEFWAPGIFSSIYVLDAASIVKIHDFYIEFPDGSVDSLNIQTKSVNEKEIETVQCKCLNQITSITMNGKAMKTDTAKYTMYGFPEDNSTYLIEK